MDQPATSASDARNTCKLCDRLPSRYTCPKCQVPYCSLECYKSERHSECSELFYKNWVETELQAQGQDSEDRQRMLDIIERTNRLDFDLEDNFVDEADEFTGEKDSSASADSDDDDDVPDLEDRLKNVNCNNADELWAALTDAERQEFEATLHNGEASKFVPPWKPWWSDGLDKKLIEEVRDERIEPDFAARCPPIIEVPTFSEIAKASPLVRFNLLNVLYAYAYTALHCNGEHQDTPRESVGVFLQLSANMRGNQVFQDALEAVESVQHEATVWQSLPRDDEKAMAAATQAVDLIINGPEDSSPNFYISAALSDLHRLFTNARNETRRFHATDGSFATKFSISGTNAELSKKSLSLCTKKTEYYLSWVKSHVTRVFPKNLSNIYETE